ncbi:MAG: Mpv17/PMP22 family protein [Bacteroidales bacterium]
MKKKDLLFVLGAIMLFTPFFISDLVYNSYTGFNKDHGMVMSFIKFAILATAGEVIGLRIRTGNYYEQGFGIIPRAIVWGFLGLTIKLSFIIFANGAPQFLTYLGLENAISAFKSNEFSMLKLFVAFSISASMNIIYAPLMMTLHKITDTHIMSNGGTVIGLFKPINFGKIISNLNWDVQYNFVFKKTIPFFWIPAHTLTFMMPPELRVLFAALLGVALGVILSIATIKSKK